MTETQRAAIRRVLEACEQRLPLVWQAAIIDELNNLRAALAEPEPEPVARATVSSNVPGRIDELDVLKVLPLGEHLLYTTPPARRSEPEPVADPFADIRGKRMSELNDEQADRARERWLRDQIDPQESYWYPHLQALFRIIDRLRAVPAEPEPVAPPARRPLTLEEIMDAVRDADLDWHTGWSLGDDAPNRFITLIRAAERAHGIGGNDE